MKFTKPLIPARLTRRYKRFLADVVVENADPAATDLTVHCPNPGSMMGLASPGLPVWLSASPDAKRKYPHTWELAELPSGMVGINTNMPNRLVAEALDNGAIAELAGYPDIRREVRYGNRSRIDFLLSGGADDRPCYVEIKNVHLRREDGAHPAAAEFPDCVTDRGARHLRDLATVAAEGCRAVMVYVVQRMDCDHFRPATDLDPVYAATLRDVARRGVETVCYACNVSHEGITVENPLPVVL